MDIEIGEDTFHEKAQYPRGDCLSETLGEEVKDSFLAMIYERFDFDAWSLGK